MSTEPTRREAMERARDTGMPALSGKVKLVQEIDVPRQAGFLLYVPVYRGNTVPATVAERREALAGWAYSPFRAGDLLSGIFGGESDPLVDFQVYDGPQADPAQLLRDSRAPPQPGAMTETQQLGFAGREWTFAFIALPALEKGSLAPAAVVFLGGLFVSLLLFRLTWLEVRARARAEEAVRDLQDADRRKDEFLAVLGHELRNPLAPVITALEVARRDHSAAERQLAVIERQARHMVRIVDDLLDVSRISRGKIEVRKQALWVRDALARAAEAVSPLASARNQKLTVSFPSRPLVVEADPVRLEQILGNLLSNAVKYTPAGGEIELSARERGASLEMRVSDTGIGLSTEAQSSLFEPFVQVPGTKDYATGGLGIGLALVRGLVQLHGGQVSVSSGGPGKGATFTVLLPGATANATPVEVRNVSPRAAHGRVLVVDDNVDAASTLAEAVRLDGHEVRVAHDGPDALEQADGFAPEVVLLDIGLPGMDGYEVVRLLRQRPQLRKTLMVALTGFGQESDRERALQAGFDEHLIKPVDLDTVHAVLRRRLGAA